MRVPPPPPRDPSSKGLQGALGCGEGTSPTPTPGERGGGRKGRHPSPHPAALGRGGDPAQGSQRVHTASWATRPPSGQTLCAGLRRTQRGLWRLWRSPGPGVSAAPQGTHHVEAGEHVPLRVLLVSLVDVGAHGHQQPQVQDGRGAAPQGRGGAAWPGRERQGEANDSRKQANCGLSRLVPGPLVTGCLRVWVAMRDRGATVWLLCPGRPQTPHGAHAGEPVTPTWPGKPRPPETVGPRPPQPRPWSACLSPRLREAGYKGDPQAPPSVSVEGDRGPAPEEAGALEGPTDQRSGAGGASAAAGGPGAEPVLPKGRG